MVENEEDVAAFKDYQPPADEATPTTPSTTPPAAEATPTAPSAPATQTPSQPPPPPTAPTAPPATAARGTAGRVFASPYAKTLAAEQGVDLQVGCYLYRLHRMFCVMRCYLSALHYYAIMLLYLNTKLL